MKNIKLIEVPSEIGAGTRGASLGVEAIKVAALDLDRRIIRVDIPPAHAGITAALRRAFEAAASEPCDRDFAELLRRLN